MIVVCVGYRDWAKEIYTQLVKDRSHIFYSFDEFNYNEKIIQAVSPDIVLYYGWSSIIGDEMISKFRCLMLHPSPLPKYRGGSPLQNQIIRGEKDSAVTIFQMSNGIDDGPLLAQAPISLEGSLDDIFSRIIEVGVQETRRILKGEYRLTDQNHKDATFFKRRTPQQSEITIEELQTSTAEELYNKVRMLDDPYPNAYIRTVDGKKLLIKKACVDG